MNGFAPHVLKQRQKATRKWPIAAGHLRHVFLLNQQIDFPNTELFQPFQRHSYSKNDLERLLALETQDYRIGGPIPDDEEVMSV